MKRKAVARAINNRTREMCTKRRRRRRFFIFESISRLVVRERGSDGWGSGEGEFSSIFFNAFRIELKSFSPHRESRCSLICQSRYSKRFFFLVQNHFGQGTHKPIDGDAVFGLNVFDSPPRPVIVLLIYTNFSVAQVLQ